MTTIRNTLEWQSRPIAHIKPYAAHSRVHNKRQIDKLKKLIRHFGQVIPIVIDREGIIVDGHAVWQAMSELGSGEIAAIVVTNRTDPEIKALRLALNRIPDDASWENERLREELEQLVNLSFDLELTGFDAVEIDHLFEVDVPKLNIAEDGEQIPAPQKSAITAIGDIWTCGRHQIGCGDARKQGFIDKVCGGLHASMCFIDPPYNVPIDGFVSGKGRDQHRDFIQGVGEMTADQFTAFLAESLAVLQRSASDGGLDLRLHGLAARLRTACRRPPMRSGPLQHVRLGKDQRRNGIALPQPART